MTPAVFLAAPHVPEWAMAVVVILSAVAFFAVANEQGWLPESGAARRFLVAGSVALVLVLMLASAVTQAVYYDSSYYCSIAIWDFFFC